MELHKQMQECDDVLARMQNMLQGFQNDLGGISDEIKHLQDESLLMNVKLKNRQCAEDLLHKFLENSNISPDLISGIMSTSVNDSFLNAVIELGKCLKYIQQSNAAKDGSSLDIPPSETYSGQILLPEYDKLKMRTILKSRDYFITQFNALRKPKTNIQVLQQSSLLRYSPLFQFIQSENSVVAEELRYKIAVMYFFLTFYIDQFM